jgi:transposase, IS605 OrfB family, central region
MKIIKGYKTELDPTSDQRALFYRYAGAARYAYNYGLTRKNEAYAKGEKYPAAIDLQKELTIRKHNDLPWLNDVSKWVVQNALRNLDDAFKRFFKKCKLKKLGQWKGKCGYPKFKSKKKGIGGFRLDCPIHVYEKAVQLPKIGTVKLKEGKKKDGTSYIPTSGVKVLNVTVSEQAGRWFVSVQVEEEVTNPAQATGQIIGVDLGIKTLATCSDGRSIENPKALRKNLKKLKRLGRSHSRKVKGGKNRKKATRKLARMHARIANIRKDALHKATSSLIAKTKPENERPSAIVIENLNVSGMLKNRKLSRAIADVGMYEFRRQLEYKSKQAGSVINVVSRWYPSSKTCSGCGWIDQNQTLNDRMFICQECGLVIGRDLNAALNLAASA